MSNVKYNFKIKFIHFIYYNLKTPSSYNNLKPNSTFIYFNRNENLNVRNLQQFPYTFFNIKLLSRKTPSSYDNIEQNGTLIYHNSNVSRYTKSTVENRDSTPLEKAAPTSVGICWLPASVAPVRTVRRASTKPVSPLQSPRNVLDCKTRECVCVCAILFLQTGRKRNRG